MASERRYYDDSYRTQFESPIADAGKWQGRLAIELETTWFYPESGGQMGDHGSIGDDEVVDVQAGDDGRVWHVVAGDVLGDLPVAVECEIDWARRFDHMQQHTGQHVLSAAFEHVANAPTLSSTLGAERSVIELGMAEMDWRAVARVEEAANRVLWEDRELRLHWTDSEGVKSFKLRKPPKVEGRIRVVEVPDWDLSACGGTHTRRTGEVGAIKVVGWEKVRGNVRVAFLCGGRALLDHAWRTEALLEAAKRRTLKDRDLIAHLERALEERDALAKQLRELNGRLLAEEARAKVGDPPRGVAEWAAERERDDVRSFALACLSAGAPWAVSAAAAPNPVVVVVRQKAAGPDLKALLPDLLAATRGKGGGSPEQLQIAAADAAGAEAAFALARDRLTSG